MAASSKTARFICFISCNSPMPVRTMLSRRAFGGRASAEMSCLLSTVSPWMLRGALAAGREPVVVLLVPLAVGLRPDALSSDVSEASQVNPAHANANSNKPLSTGRRARKVIMRSGQPSGRRRSYWKTMGGAGAGAGAGAGGSAVVAQAVSRASRAVARGRRQKARRCMRVFLGWAYLRTAAMKAGSA